MKKNYLSVILAGILLAASLSACGSADKTVFNVISHTINVPDVTGMFLCDAKEVLDDRGFFNYKSNSGEEFIWNEDEWVVDEQSIPEGETVDCYDEIVLQCVKVEDYKGQVKSLDEVEASQGEEAEEEEDTAVTLPAKTGDTETVNTESKVEAEEISLPGETLSKVDETESLPENEDASPVETESSSEDSLGAANDYVLNTESYIFHVPDCYNAFIMADENREDITASRDEIIGMGYHPCENCNP